MEPVLVNPKTGYSRFSLVYAKHSPKVADEVRALQGHDEQHGNRCAPCMDCGVMTTRSHCGDCETIAALCGVRGSTLKGLRAGQRNELVDTQGMKGKRVRQEIVVMDILGCALDKPLSRKEMGTILVRLGRAFHKKARQDLEVERDALRDAIVDHNSD